MEPRCPLTAQHSLPRSLQAVRCFKLGRGRRSYNEVTLQLTDGSGGQRTAAVQQCIHIPAAAQAAEAQESSIAFRVQLPGRSLLCRLFLVFDDPKPVDEDGTEAGGASGGGRHSWRPVSRQHCTKGCQGPVLATSRRLSSLGKRRADGAGSSLAPAGPKEAAAQHPRHMYVSIDEPCTHCGVTSFRLVAGVYDESPGQQQAAPTSSGSHSAAGAVGQQPAAADAPQGAAERLLATTVSQPLKVLANNDVPTGPGKILLEAALPADWEGWSDPAVWDSSNAEAPSAAGAQPAACEPQQPRCKARRSCSAPSLGANSDSCSPRSMPLPGAAAAAAAVEPKAAASAPAPQAVEALPAGFSQMEHLVQVEVVPAAAPSPSLSGWQELQPAAAAALSLRSRTPMLFAAPPQPLLPFGVASSAPQPALPAYSHPRPSAEAAAPAAWQQQQVLQQQPARQAALAASASLPVLPVQLASGGSGCMPLQAEPAAAHLRRYQSDGVAGVLHAQAQQAAASQGEQAATAARRLARKQAAKSVPGFYRAVSTQPKPTATPSPFGPPPGALGQPSASFGGSAAVPSFGGAAARAGQLSPAPHAPAQWQAQLPQQPLAAAAASLPVVESLHSWRSDLRSTSSTPQPGAALLPGGHGVAPASSPAPAWPMQQASTLSPALTGLSGGSGMGGSGTPVSSAGWDAMPWAAYHASATRRSDVQLLAVGLAAAGRLGLLPNAMHPLDPSLRLQHAPGYQQAAAEQQAAAAQQAAYRQALAQQQAAAYQQAAARQQAAYQQAVAVAQQQAAAQQQQAAAHQRAGAQLQAAAQYQPATAAPQQQQASAAGAGPAAAPELPSDADLLGLMLDYPLDFDSMVNSIFDDAPPF